MKDKWLEKNKIMKLPCIIDEIIKFDDFLLIKSLNTHYIIIEFRGEFLKTRISKNKYTKFLNSELGK